MKDIEEQMEGAEEIPMSRATTSPLDVEGVDLNISTDEIVHFIVKSRRSMLPAIVNGAIGQPLPALSADKLVAIEH